MNRTNVFGKINHPFRELAHILNTRHIRVESTRLLKSNEHIEMIYVCDISRAIVKFSEL